MSATPRLFLGASFAAGERVELDQPQSHYLSRVMRLGPGDVVRVFNGRDGEFEAVLADVSKRCVSLELGRQTRAQAEGLDLWLAFTPVKKAASDLIVEKSVELGARRILPVRTRRCTSPSVRLDRYERIAIEAAEQTERLDVPEIAPECVLADMLEQWSGERALIFCDESGDDRFEPWGGDRGVAPPLAEVARGLKGKPAAILIGPEGGFTPEERQNLRSREFVSPVSLGPRILRAETAAIAAMAVWQAVSGDWATVAPEN